MFSTWKTRAALIIYVLLILSIPVGAYLATQQQIFKSSAKESIQQKSAETKPPITSPPPSDAPKELTDLAQELKQLDASPSPSPEPASGVSVSFGPTLTLKLILEGRPANNQTAKVFIGIAQGGPVNNPKYLLSFTIDLPSSGLFSGLSLAGLEPGETYTAYIKGPVQIATASAFLMNPSVTNLNGGQPITLLTGDLNEDNIINSADFSIAKALLGTTPSSEDWNESADFNKDSRINSVDLGYIIKNFGKSGESGAWISTPAASGSATLDEQSNSSQSGGFWIWVPQL